MRCWEIANIGMVITVEIYSGHSLAEAKSMWRGICLGRIVDYRASVQRDYLASGSAFWISIILIGVGLIIEGDALI